jgi:hypothetical protein
MLIDSLYSLPPRLKRFPLLAALSIATARGVISNLGLALHFGAYFDVRIPLLTLLMLGLFFFGFGLVIAFYKDLPDQEVDRAHNIPTFANRFGPQRVILLGKIVLTIGASASWSVRPVCCCWPSSGWGCGSTDHLFPVFWRRSRQNTGKRWSVPCSGFTFGAANPSACACARASRASA